MYYPVLESLHLNAVEETKIHFLSSTAVSDIQSFVFIVLQFCVKWPLFSVST